MIEISKPTLVIDKEICLANIRRMYDKAINNKVIFRPHFKTHQSAFIGNWFRKMGIHSITVSSPGMAKYFSAYGWRDITIAFPLNIREAFLIGELASEVSLNVIIDNADVIPLLENALNTGLGLFIEIDTGHHRTGLAWKDHKEIDRILEKVRRSPHITFKGFLTHSGHTYHADSREEVADIFKDTMLKLNYLKEHYQAKWPDMILSVGDTPSCSIVDNFEGVDEIRPGNFVFYDLMQYSIGSCRLEDIALALACPVVSVSHQRNQFTIYGGAIHLSKEFLFKSSGERIYGYLVNFNDKEWGQPLRGTYLTNLAQEHGIVQTTREILEQVKIGDVVGILPVHSCLTASSMHGYVTLTGENINY